MGNYKTTGEVEKETGIKKRVIKYYIEQGFFTPTKKTNGKKTIWYYSKEDIKKLNQIHLYSELGYTNKQIKKLIYDSNFDWDNALDQQIILLRKKKRHIENLLIAAEFMRLVNYLQNQYCDFDMDDFDNSIDDFSNGVFSSEAEDNTEQGIMMLGEQISDSIDLEKLNEIGTKFYDYISKFKDLSNEDPKNSSVQLFIDQICKDVSQMFPDLNSKMIIFGIRMLPTLGIDRMIDMVVGKENTIDYIEEAIAEYIKNEGEDKNG